MSSKRKLQESFTDSEDCDSKSNSSEAEEEEFSLHKRQRKKKIYLDSGSESESGLLDLDKNIKDDEKLNSASNEDEPLSKTTDASKGKGKVQKILASCDTSDDEVVAKTKSFKRGSKTYDSIENLDYRADATLEGDEPLENKTEHLKEHTSLNSPDDKPLVAQSRNSSIHSDASKISSNLSSVSNKNRLEDTSDNDDEAISNIAKKKSSELKRKSKEKQHNSSDSSDDEPIAKKYKKSSSDNSNYEPIANKYKRPKNSDDEKEKNLHSDHDDELKATSDEDRTISQIAASAKSKSLDTSSCNSSSSCNSDDEPLKSRKSSKYLKTNKKTKIVDPASDKIKSETSSDEEPLSKMIKSSKTKEKSKANSSASDSDDEPLATKSKSSKQKIHSRIDKNQSATNGNNTSSDEEPLSKFVKGSKNVGKVKQKKNSRISSDDEPLATKMKQKSKPPKNSDLSSDEEDKPISSLKRSIKVNKKKDNSSSNSKIEHLKKYLRVAGIHVNSYDKLFEDCKSIKSKVEKLLGLLHKKGLKGRPTIEKCKKLKKKIETKKEIAELDISNIIKSEGRPKRGAGGKIIEKLQNTKSSPAAKKMSRLQDIIDSEESE